PDGSVAGEMGRNGRRNHTDSHRPPHVAPQGNQDAGRNTRGWPEDGDAIRLGLQKKAQTRRPEIYNADCDSELDRNQPPLLRAAILREPTLSLFQGDLQHIATSPRVCSLKHTNELSQTV